MSRGGLLSYLSRDLPNRRVRVRVISTSAEMEGVVPSGRYPEIPRKRTRKARTADFLRLLPRARSSVLDIGARNGHFSRLLTEYFDVVTGLDLEKPPFEYPQVTTVAGHVRRFCLFRAGYPNEYGTIIGYSDAWELDPRRVFQGREPMINSHRYRRADVEPRPTGVNRALVPNNVSVPEEIARYLHIARWRF